MSLFQKKSILLCLGLPKYKIYLYLDWRTPGQSLHSIFRDQCCAVIVIDELRLSNAIISIREYKVQKKQTGTQEHFPNM